MKNISLILFLTILGIQILTPNCFAQIPELWGTTTQGGSGDGSAGVLYKINGDGTGISVIHDFNINSIEGRCSWAGLVKTSTGKLYGITSGGGTHNAGTIFMYDTTNNTYTKLYDCLYPSMEDMILASDSLFYGVSLGGGPFGGIIFSFNPLTNVYAVLCNLTESNPEGSLLLANNGKLYGMTYGGGLYSYGTIFSFDISTNSYTKIFDFDGTNGKHPQAHGGLMQASNGMLYGTTYEGGSNDCGVIFTINPLNNAYTKILDLNWGTGIKPQGKIIQASNGILYGTTTDGGGTCGVIFSINPLNNAYTTLHNFDDGCIPYNSILEGSDGKLYGITWAGGASAPGTIYSFDVSNNNFNKVLDFNSTNGAYPGGDLIELKTNPVVSSVVEPKVAILNNIVVFPNPASSLLTITNITGKKTLRLYDTLGKLMLEKLVENNATIDISYLTNGIYYIVTENNIGKSFNKVVIYRQ